MSTETLDPIAALEQMARRQGAEETAKKAIQKARVQLVLGKDSAHAFFATLALRLKAIPDWQSETCSTDGRSLKYSPEFVNALTAQERVGVLAHEVMHNALAHSCRRGTREHKRFNVAADLAVNPILRDAGFALPSGALFPGKPPYADLPEGLSAEDYYSRLPHDAGNGHAGDDPGGCGAVEDAGDPAQQQAAEAEMRVAVAQAATAARQRGELPGALARLVGEIVEPTVPWQDVLREFMSRAMQAREDWTWSVPDRRFLAQGIYLPSLRSDGMGEVVVAIDTSGSIDEDTLATFCGELNGILECQPCSVTVLYCDAEINKVVRWEPADGELVLEACGGAGTSHRPIWDWLKRNDAAPACVVCLSDGLTCWGEDPGVPVLWALTEDRSPPFGQKIRVG